MEQQVPSSYEVSRAALRMAATASRQEEKTTQAEYREIGIQACAVDFGGDFNNCTTKVVERAVVAAKREGMIADTHKEIGCVAGAAHDALRQVSDRAMGLSVGGKIGLARQGEHLTVCIFFAAGLLHLNEVVVGLAHRAV